MNNNETNPQSESQNQPLDQPTGIQMKTKKGWKIVLIAVVALLVITIIAGMATILWYKQQLTPLNANNPDKQKIVIEPGSSPKVIANQLQREGIIRSGMAFNWYVRLQSVEGELQAGTYRLGPSMNIATIVEHLTSGKTDSFTITFYPGATLRDTTDRPEGKKTDVTTVLLRAGYSKEEIDSALAAKYDHPLFATKPTSADLEGYIYGETYNFPSTATVKEILEYTFDEMYKVVQQENLIQKYKKRDLTLYEGIILASIVQREIGDPKDQPKVAGVFFNRLEKGMNLGSDVTYQYIADKTGVARDPSLQSKYNTRIHAGLPPGPIAAPGASALLAVAEPTETEYLFFLSGDDDVTYFGKTVEDHERNIEQHCQKKCQIL